MARTSEFSSGALPSAAIAEEPNRDSHQADAPLAAPTPYSNQMPSAGIAATAYGNVGSQFAASTQKLSSSVTALKAAAAAKPEEKMPWWAGADAGLTATQAQEVETAKAKTEGDMLKEAAASATRTAGYGVGYAAAGINAVGGSPSLKGTKNPLGKPITIGGTQFYKPIGQVATDPKDAASGGKQLLDAGTTLAAGAGKAAGAASEVLTEGTALGRAIKTSNTLRTAAKDASASPTIEVPAPRPNAGIDPGFTSGVVPNKIPAPNPNYVQPGPVSQAVSKAASSVKAAAAKPVAGAMLATELATGSFGGLAGARAIGSSAVKAAEEASAASKAIPTGSWTPKAASFTADTTSGDVAASMRSVNAAKAASAAEKVEPWVGTAERGAVGAAAAAANMGPQFNAPNSSSTSTTAVAPTTYNSSTTSQAPTTNPSPTTNAQTQITNDVTKGGEAGSSTTKAGDTSQNLTHNTDYDITKTNDATNVNSTIPAVAEAQVVVNSVTNTLGQGSGDGASSEPAPKAKEEPIKKPNINSGSGATTPTDFAYIPKVY